MSEMDVSLFGGSQIEALFRVDYPKRMSCQGVGDLRKLCSLLFMEPISLVETRGYTEIWQLCDVGDAELKNWAVALDCWLSNPWYTTMVRCGVPNDMLRFRAVALWYCNHDKRAFKATAPSYFPVAAGGYAEILNTRTVGQREPWRDPTDRSVWWFLGYSRHRGWRLSRTVYSSCDCLFCSTVTSSFPENWIAVQFWGNCWRWSHSLQFCVIDIFQRRLCLFPICCNWVVVRHYRSNFWNFFKRASLILFVNVWILSGLYESIFRWFWCGEQVKLTLYIFLSAIRYWVRTIWVLNAWKSFELLWLKVPKEFAYRHWSFCGLNWTHQL